MLRLDEFLPYQLSVASNAVSSAIARTYEVLFGLRVPEWRLIAVLAEQEGVTQQALVARTEMDKMTVSRAAQALVSRGLVTRVPHGRDKRSHTLALSEEGRALYAQIAPKALELEQRLLHELGAREVAQLKATLAKLKSASHALR
ncbi:MarR family transcriptional regulator [Sphingomonas sp. MAH-20]|jgi:DNA-binding MarR family transcriptional regulator|uniref:MarR family transcriptional regulator n=1 Tax=Sphingomonas horti TaxID=2682842 RepID=A0A6I4J4Y8_9SPHN|nr:MULTISPECIES: MarR family transcriptional regulator [Sphingomonas]MBA2919241.1 MarR family transcriptional regulator [Sphingomonas sp. CGMCC 1.13658]MVO79274.1 MarR family transcriptional regulator [Sphingomonas horti]